MSRQLSHKDDTRKAPPTRKAKQAVIYLRGAEHRRAHYQEMAAQLHATIVDEYIDRDVSALDLRRPGLVAMLDRLQANPDVDYVIVPGLEHLARGHEDGIQLEQAIEQRGARLAVAGVGVMSPDPIARFVEAAMRAVGEYASRQRMTDIREGRARPKAQLDSSGEARE